MEVRRIEDGSGELQKLEFVKEPEDVDFKQAIKTWLLGNNPMNYEEFFDRLQEFRMGKCVINML